MKKCTPVLITALTLGARASAAPADIMIGTFTNEEEVYFDTEEGRTPAPWIGMTISREGDKLRLRTVDAFGKPGAESQLITITQKGDMTEFGYGKCTRTYQSAGKWLVAAGTRGTCGAPASIVNFEPRSLKLMFADGITTTLTRARPVSCWAAIPKDTKKPDGSDDWYFVNDLKMHDQGGRVSAGGGDTGAKPIVLRMRNVIWSTGTNRPSIVLYVHTPDAPDKAVSYAWADPDAKRLGINLRWMQASCTIDTATQGDIK
jgi:hypothetical protein